MEQLKTAILVGFVMGFFARIITLKSDYRRYPSYPQGFAIHAVLGAVSAAVGALVVPAVLAGEYTAVSFFALAVQQFREVKNAERDTLTNLERDEIVKRGNAYIEDIARKFEVRNYLAMITAFLVSVSILIFKHFYIGIIVGLLLFIVVFRFIKEKYVKDIADVSEETLHFKDMYLKAGNVVITNIAPKEVKDVWIERGRVCRITPKDENARMTLANLGQQQAIVHDVIAQLGTINDATEPWLTPFVKMDIEDGSILVAVVTYENDKSLMELAMKNCPVIESARKEPKKSKVFKRELKKNGK